jgi:hypothetical protein
MRKKVSYGRVPVRALPVPWKLGTLEERRKDKRRLFGTGCYRNRGKYLEKGFWYFL